MKRSPRHDWRESRGARGGSDPQSHVRLEGAPADVRAFGRWFTKNANEDEEAVPLVPLKGKDLERNALASKTRRQPTAPQGVPPGLVSATRTASAALTRANRGWAGNDSRESAGAFCCLSATTLATNVETKARASLSHWRASSGNPAGAHENVLLVVVDPPLRKRNAGE